VTTQRGVLTPKNAAAGGEFHRVPARRLTTTPVPSPPASFLIGSGFSRTFTADKHGA